MNRAQRAVIAVGMVLVLAIGLYVPYRIDYPGERREIASLVQEKPATRSVEFSFVFSPPNSFQRIVSIDVPILASELAVVILLVTGGIILFREYQS